MKYLYTSRVNVVALLLCCQLDFCRLTDVKRAWPKSKVNQY